MYRRQEKTLLKKQEKQVTEANAKAYHLHAKHFKCEPDALAAAAALAAKWPLLEASEPEVSARTVNTPGRKSRPKAGEETTVYTVSLVFEKSAVAFGEACKGLGKFMLATNDLTLGDE